MNNNISKFRKFKQFSKVFSLVLIVSALTFSCSGNKNKNQQKQDSTKVKNQSTSTFSDTSSEKQEITAFDPKAVQNIPKPKSFNDKLSYLSGMDFGASMKAQNIKPNPDFFALGINHGYNGNNSFMSKDELEAMKNEVAGVMKVKAQKQMEVQKKKWDVIGAKNLKDGEAFLKANKSKPGVQVTSSGLQYQVLAQGSGKSPQTNDLVVLNIKGSFIDGKEIDNTNGKEPVTAPIGAGMLPGLKEALLMMKPGAKYKLFMPPALAYGKQGVFPNIPPNTVLILEIQLLENKGKAPAKQESH